MANQEALYSEGETYNEGMYGEANYGEGSFNETNFNEGSFNEGNFNELSQSGESPFANEMTELELATEFLEINTEDEFSSFLKKVWGKVKGGAQAVAQDFTKSADGQKIINVVKNCGRDLAKNALPAASHYLGDGAHRLAKKGSDFMQDKAQGWSDAAMQSPFLSDGNGGRRGRNGRRNQNQGEMEAEFAQRLVPARAFVRFAGDAFRRFGTLPYRRTYPDLATRLAVTQAANRYYPTILGGAGATIAIGDLPAEGTWRLEGRSIILDF